ncbi:MAG: hypothetical protein ACJA16_004408, partial [Akkermansiaceae bacterium]
EELDDAGLLEDELMAQNEGQGVIGD